MGGFVVGVDRLIWVVKLVRVIESTLRLVWFVIVLAGFMGFVGD